MCEFKVGEKVWLDNTKFIDDPKWIREPQTIERIEQVPLNDGNEVYSISLVDIPYFFIDEDIRKI